MEIGQIKESHSDYMDGCHEVVWRDTKVLRTAINPRDAGCHPKGMRSFLKCPLLDQLLNKGLLVGGCGIGQQFGRVWWIVAIICRFVGLIDRS
jgi:hypothetical protein